VPASNGASAICAPRARPGSVLARLVQEAVSREPGAQRAERTRVGRRDVVGHLGASQQVVAEVQADHDVLRRETRRVAAQQIQVVRRAVATEREVVDRTTDSALELRRPRARARRRHAVLRIPDRKHVDVLRHRAVPEAPRIVPGRARPHDVWQHVVRRELGLQKIDGL
jgi:hypothetical protein